MYELIPSGEPNSCFDKETDSVLNNSKWIVNDKNNEKCSIHSFFDNNIAQVFFVKATWLY